MSTTRDRRPPPAITQLDPGAVDARLAGWRWGRQGGEEGAPYEFRLTAPDGWATKFYQKDTKAVAEALRRVRSQPQAQGASPDAPARVALRPGPTISPDDWRELAPAEIRRDGGTQARTGNNEEVVEAYTAEMREGRWRWHEGNRLVVFFDGEAHWLADGFHRTEAAQRAGLTSVPCEVRDGTRRDAVLYAVGANADHGMRRTRDDVRRAIRTLLLDEEWRVWSNAEIARRARTTDKTVAAVRSELESTSEIPRLTERVGADGKTRQAARFIPHPMRPDDLRDGGGYRVFRSSQKPGQVKLIAPGQPAAYYPSAPAAYAAARERIRGQQAPAPPTVRQVEQLANPATLPDLPLPPARDFFAYQMAIRAALGESTLEGLRREIAGDARLTGEHRALLSTLIDKRPQDWIDEIAGNIRSCLLRGSPHDAQPLLYGLPAGPVRGRWMHDVDRVHDAQRAPTPDAARVYLDRINDEALRAGLIKRHTEHVPPPLPSSPSAHPHDQLIAQGAGVARTFFAEPAELPPADEADELIGDLEVVEARIEEGIAGDDDRRALARISARADALGAFGLGTRADEVRRALDAGAEPGDAAPAPELPTGWLWRPDLPSLAPDPRPRHQARRFDGLIARAAYDRAEAAANAAATERRHPALTDAAEWARLAARAEALRGGRLSTDALSGEAVLEAAGRAQRHTSRAELIAALTRLELALAPTPSDFPAVVARAESVGCQLSRGTDGRYTLVEPDGQPSVYEVWLSCVGRVRHFELTPSPATPAALDDEEPDAIPADARPLYAEAERALAVDLRGAAPRLRRFLRLVWATVGMSDEALSDDELWDELTGALVAAGDAELSWALHGEPSDGQYPPGFDDLTAELLAAEIDAASERPPAAGDVARWRDALDAMAGALDARAYERVALRLEDLRRVAS